MPKAVFQHPFSLAQRRWTCATFTLMACLLFADQNLLAPNVRTLMPMPMPMLFPMSPMSHATWNGLIAAFGGSCILRHE